jgi:hypothetical protein
MGFDFGKAEKRAIDSKREPLIAAIVLAPPSGGKSYLAGTFGVKTLYLHTSGEEHGPDSARIEGRDLVVPVPIDYDETGKKLGPDAGLKRLVTILEDVEGVRAAGFKAIVIDGLSELEQLIRNTSQFKIECLSKEGNHNGFAEPAATLKGLRPVLDGLRTLQRDARCHYFVTCILDAKEVAEDGQIIDSEPQLLGYKVATSLIPQFPDRLVLGRMQSPEGKEVHRIQFNASMTKASIDNKTKELKKFTNFAPQLSGVKSDKLPIHMVANMQEVLKLKIAGGKV